MRKDRGGNADQADAAMRRRCRETDHIDHGAAPNNQHIGVPVDTICVDRMMNCAYVIRVIFDMLSAWHNQCRTHKR